jgi:hypothetical protein
MSRKHDKKQAKTKIEKQARKKEKKEKRREKEEKKKSKRKFNFRYGIVAQSSVKITRFAGLAEVGKMLDLAKTHLDHLDRLDLDNPDSNAPAGEHSSLWIPHSAVFKAVFCMLCTGKTSYADIVSLNGDPLFLEIVGQPISEETLRQRLDKMGRHPGVGKIVGDINLEVLKRCRLKTADCEGRQFFQLDIDPTPMDNAKTHREGVGPVYDGTVGYCPSMVFIGGELAVLFEQRPGPRHSINGAPELIDRAMDLTGRRGVEPEAVLAVLDSGHDGAAVFRTCDARKSKFIVKCNHRREARLKAGPMLKLARRLKVEPRPDGKVPGRLHYCFLMKDDHPSQLEDGIPCWRVADVVVDTLDSDGRPVGNELEHAKSWSWWTNLETGDPWTIVELYRQHASMEQCHGELKSDMHFERMPSGKFSTNALFLQMAAVSFNILRWMGFKLLESGAPLPGFREGRQPGRLRLRTIIDNICLMPAALTATGGRARIAVYAGDPWFHAFKEMHARC